MTYTFEGSNLTVKSGKTIKFDFPIQEAVEIGDAIVVCLAVPVTVSYPDNVFAIDRDGNFLWQVKPTVHLVKNSRYVGLYRRGPLVRLANIDGVVYDVDPNTGVVVSKLLAR